MRKAEREQQLDFRALRTMRWEELPASVREQMREMVWRLLCAVAAGARERRDGSDHDAAQ